MERSHFWRPFLRSALRILAAVLPAGVRSRLKDHLRQLLLPNDPLSHFSPFTGRGPLRPIDAPLGLNIIGYVRSEHGVGESVRSSARAVTATGLPFCLLDFNVGNVARTADDTWTAQLANRPIHALNLCHINADQMPLLYAALGNDCFAGRYTVGHWAWELPEFPDRWADSFALVDEVWALSQFTADTISRKSPVPVVRMPLCIQFAVEPATRRADFGLPNDRFLFLTMYDTQSFQERKNPEGVIDAFRRAFPHAHDIGLVVKINHPQSHPEKVRELKRRLTELPGVQVIDRTLTRQQVYDLLGLCDAFVSLHRAEGFGLALAEAMFLGKPVVATHWSGNVDFMTVANSYPVRYELVRLRKDVGPYAKGQSWAEPDLDHAAWHLRRLVKHTALRRTVSQCGQETIRTHFSPAAVGNLYRQRLAVIAQKLAVRPLAA